MNHILTIQKKTIHFVLLEKIMKLENDSLEAILLNRAKATPLASSIKSKTELNPASGV